MFCVIIFYKTQQTNKWNNYAKKSLKLIYPHFQDKLPISVIVGK